MSAPSSGTAMRAVLRIAGAIAMGTGLSVMARGTRAIPGGGPVPPSVDNVLRFYAAWWAGTGALLWRIAPDTREHDALLKGILGANLLGAFARILSARQTGRPHMLFQVITVEELVLSPTALLLQRKIMSGRPLRRQRVSSDAELSPWPGPRAAVAAEEM
ncbi:DUF4345 domain-containing protein [Actinomycetes bacterium KLBMP 9759]